MKIAFINGGNFHAAIITGEKDTPLPTPHLASPSSLAHSLSHQIDEGALYIWGRNSKGQLGLGGGGNKKTPQLLDAFGGLKVTAVVCGDLHTLCVTGNHE